MTTLSNELSPRKTALVAGAGLFIMTIFIIFSAVYGFANLILPGDAAGTANNILANEKQFRTGVFCYLIVILFDLIVAWALYDFLKPVNNSLSLLAAWSRLVYTVVYASILTYYLNVLQLLSNANYLSLLDTEHLYAQVMLSLNAFTDGWSIGYIFFGLHLALIGYLAFKSDYIPKILGIVLILTGSSYLVDYFGKILFPNMLTVSTVFGWGELLFMIWLLYKGVKKHQLEEVST